uniref:G-protein coupled receptors family 1 profile domain-containing protein n=1 Tax=Meloidogyne incognita TaxID=6306 RepID=A0A914MPV6_MELIC
MLYSEYKNSGPSSLLIVPSVIMCVEGVPGIAANFLLIYVTIQNKNLRGPTNYLLALTAFFEILHQSGHFLFLVVAVSGINLIDYSTALIFQLHSIFGVTAAQTSMASTAADRLLSVLIPLKYNIINIRLYLSIHTLLAFSSGIWMSINAINLSNKYPTLPVTGHIGDLCVYEMNIMFQFIMLLCAITSILYIFVWIAYRFLSKANNVTQSDSQSRLLKSLIFIVSIVIGGYVMCSISHLVINQFFNLNDIQQWLVGVFGSILLNIGASSETPTLYIFSSIYREAIKKQLKQLFCKKTQNNVISVVPGLVNRGTQVANRNGRIVTNNSLCNISNPKI